MTAGSPFNGWKDVRKHTGRHPNKEDAMQDLKTFQDWAKACGWERSPASAGGGATDSSSESIQDGAGIGIINGIDGGIGKEFRQPVEIDGSARHDPN